MYTAYYTLRLVQNLQTRLSRQERSAGKYLPFPAAVFALLANIDGIIFILEDAFELWGFARAQSSC